MGDGATPNGLATAPILDSTTDKDNLTVLCVADRDYRVSGLKSSHFLAHILCDREFVWAHFQRDWAQIVCDGLTPVRPDARTELVSVRSP
jgi:hypothetical protein